MWLTFLWFPAAFEEIYLVYQGFLLITDDRGKRHVLSSLIFVPSGLEHLVSWFVRSADRVVMFPTVCPVRLDLPASPFPSEELSHTVRIKAFFQFFNQWDYLQLKNSAFLILKPRLRAHAGSEPPRQCAVSVCTWAPLQAPLGSSFLKVPWAPYPITPLSFVWGKPTPLLLPNSCLPSRLGFYFIYASKHSPYYTNSEEMLLHLGRF